jgi:hypothetical protein
MMAKMESYLSYNDDHYWSLGEVISKFFTRKNTLLNWGIKDEEVWL